MKTVDTQVERERAEASRALQSLLRYGTNSIEAPLMNKAAWGAHVLVFISLAVALLAALFAIAMHRERGHLDRAVERVERASR